MADSYYATGQIGEQCFVRDGRLWTDDEKPSSRIDEHLHILAEEAEWRIRHHNVGLVE